MAKMKTMPQKPLRSGPVLCILVLLLAGLTGCYEGESPLEGNVKVFKYTERLQCQPDSGITLEDMQMELVDTGIDVLCAQSGDDGMVYPNVCGGSTGDINIYEIRRVNYEDALALGFMDLSVLTGYLDTLCR